MKARSTLAVTHPIPELEKFNLDFETLGDPKLEGMVAAARAFCADLLSNRGPHWISFLGPSGIGKTHLAKKIGEFYRMQARYYRHPIAGALLVRSGGYTESWRKRANDLREKNYSRFRDMQNDHLLVLDDIGSEHESKFVISKLDELLDARLQKWTVITANFSLEQISEKMDARIASRMIRNGSVVIDCDVEDYNLRTREFTSVSV